MNHDLPTEDLAKLIESAQPRYEIRELAGQTIIIPNAALENGQPVSLNQFEAKPQRIEASRTLSNVPSFAHYVNRFKSSESLVFGSLKDGKITALLDYHGVNDPSWVKHNATLELRKSEDFKRWESINDKPLTQNAFAEFLEDMAHTVVQPDSATLIEIAMKAEATKGLKFEQKVNRTDGSVTLVYNEEVGTKGSWKLPSVIHVSVALFEASKPTNLAVQLRFRIGEGGISFRLVLTQLDKLLRDEFLAVSALVEDAVSMPVLQQ